MLSLFSLKSVGEKEKEPLIKLNQISEVSMYGRFFENSIKSRQMIPDKLAW